jgi:hypothetical protein
MALNVKLEPVLTGRTHEALRGRLRKRKIKHAKPVAASKRSELARTDPGAAAPEVIAGRVDVSRQVACRMRLWSSHSYG